MSHEVFEMIKTMDLDAAETQLALHCAPLITGLKVSNLLIVQNGQVKNVQQLFYQTEISCFILYTGEHKTVLLLYRFQPLRGFLAKPQACKMLRESGYYDLAFEGLLSGFAGRYTAYMQGRAEFPHEMGLFLGYPVEDVRGFMENHGKNFLCAGYWKVYQNEKEKVRLFHKFDLAKELLIRLAAEGVHMPDIINACSRYQLFHGSSLPKNSLRTQISAGKALEGYSSTKASGCPY